MLNCTSAIRCPINTSGMNEGEEITARELSVKIVFKDIQYSVAKKIESHQAAVVVIYKGGKNIK